MAERNEETKRRLMFLASPVCTDIFSAEASQDIKSALAHIETLEKLVTQAAEQIRDVTAQQSVADASFDLVQRINKYLFCAKEQGGSEEPVSEKEQLIADIAKFLAPCCDDRIEFHVLLKRAKALLEKGEPKNG